MPPFFARYVYPPSTMTSPSDTTCETCKQVVVDTPIPEPPVLRRQAAGDNLDDADAADADAATFHEAFEAMTLKLPPSERTKTLERFKKGSINPLEDTPEGKAIVEKAFGQYAKRLERSRAGSAKRRAAKKVAAVPAPVVAEQTPVAV